MFYQSNAIRHEATPVRPVLRIAVPSWASSSSSKTAEATDRRMPCREEFKRMLDSALHPTDWIHGRLTRSERKQLAATQKIRQALYGSGRTSA